MAFAMIRDFPGMKVEAKKANQLLQQLIEKKEIDIVISDNRYELYSEKIFTVFVSHQLNIQTPGVTSLFKPFIQRTINNYIRRFDELWIPDCEETPNLSGKLSHTRGKPLDNFYFIGPLSRFSITRTENKIESPDLLIMLSGPEPQRTILEEKLTGQALSSNLDTIVLQGKPEQTETKEIENVKVIPHLDDRKIAGLIKNADIIISRPGYSTIMDLAVLGKKAIFIPTPGQTEQEFLADKYKREGLFYSENQKQFDLKRAIKHCNSYSGLLMNWDSTKLNHCIDRLLSD